MFNCIHPISPSSLFGRLSSFLFPLLFAWVFLPVSLMSQSCFDEWTRPVVCGLVGRVALEGEGSRRLDLGRRVKVPVGSEVTIELHGVDQKGYTFPDGDLSVDLDLGGDVRDYVKVVSRRAGEYRLRTKERTGKITLHFTAANNLNVGLAIPFEVTPIRNLTRRQAQFMVKRIYRAILDREPDRSGFEPAVLEVMRGRIHSLVDSMFHSHEFRRKRRPLPATRILDGFYHGLFGRSVDSAGVRHYLRKVEKHKYTTVLLDMLSSEEFQRKLLRK